MDANEILSKMSIEEKLKLTSGKDFWHLVDFEKYGIPSIMVTDGPHGLRKEAEKGMSIANSVPSVAFPTASCSACSWDPKVLYKMGKAMGEECASENVSVILGPGVNMKRSPLCGRNFEYFSEDPVLAGEIAAGLINGVQSVGVGTSLKHYACNSQETHRMTGSSNLDERTLREYYLQAFEIAVKKSQPYTVMTSYNKINNVSASGNKFLNLDILRDEWKYDGCVITDWGGGHCHYEDLNGGLDLEMPGNKQLYLKETLKAYKEGKISEETINRAAFNVLKLIEKTVQFYDCDTTYSVHEHHAVAREVAQGSIVLLKNSTKTLPLQLNKPLIIGEFAKTPRYQGAGSSHLNPHKLDSFISTLEENNIEFDFAPGYLIETGKGSDTSLIEEAVAKVTPNSQVILFIGLTDEYETEGNDRQSMKLPDAQVELVNKVLEINPNAVLVLSTGSPVELPFLDKATTIVNGYLGGEAGASAMFDIITGAICPSGKLAETWPISADDAPCSETYTKEMNQVNYREGFFSGYRYYNTAKVDVQFPFGFGLSYTTFEYSNAKVDGDKVCVDIKNTGSVDGAEIIQLYIANKTKATIFAENELRHFDKVFLAAGETKTVEFTLCERDFQFFSLEKKEYVTAQGDYEIQIGSSSRDIKATIAIKKNGEVIDEFAKYENTWFTTFNGKPTDEDLRVLGVEAIHEKFPKKGNFTLENTVEDMQQAGFGKFLYKLISWAVRVFVVKASKEEMKLPQNKMIMDAATGISVRGMAAMSGGIMKLGLARFLVKLCNGFSKPSKDE